MTKQDCKKVEMMVELGVRRYFDHYLEDIFPKQIAAVMEAHDKAADAHGGITGQFMKFRWLIVGAAAGGGLGFGTMIHKLIPFLG